MELERIAENLRGIADDLEEVKPEQKCPFTGIFRFSCQYLTAMLECAYLYELGTLTDPWCINQIKLAQSVLKHYEMSKMPLPKK